jgi:YegS/Rv2252/BmrU family lipid kinase
MPDTNIKKRILFIVNPISGSRRRRNHVELINDHVDRNKYDINIALTKYAGHAIEISRQAVKDKYDVIVAVGGDGTVNEVASQMINSNSTLGIIPGGSGNGLARHLNIPLTVLRAISLLNKGIVTTIDTATVNNKPFISIAGVGFDALVAKKFAKSPRRGFLTYFRIVANEFLTYKPKKYKLSFDEGLYIKRRAFFISFANSNQFGYNAKIAPNARLNDGKIDICIAQKPNVFQTPVVANLMLLKLIDKSPLMDIISTTGVVIKRKKNKVINIDGEPVKLDKELVIKVVPSSLKVIIPQNGPK